MEIIYTSLSSLESFSNSVFSKMGCNDQDAKVAAKFLVNADRRGIDSHGVARLSGYVRLWKKGRINTSPNMVVETEAPAALTLNADAGLGMVAGFKTMDQLLKKSEQTGVAFGVVKNSNHFGIAASYVEMALQAGAIGWAMTNASPLVSPAGGKERLLGTNPICVGIPAGKEAPFLLDMATTTAANGKLEVLKRKGKSAPTGWVLDANGNPTQDIDALSKGGAMVPLGSNSDGAWHKGYGLGALVDILSGVLPGAGFGPWVPPFVAFLEPKPNAPGDGIGHFFGVMRPEAFRNKQDFLNDMDLWLKTFRNSAATDSNQPVMIPGDPERAIAEAREKQGTPLPSTVLNDLNTLAQELSLPPLKI